MSVYTIASQGLSVQSTRFAAHSDAIAAFNPSPSPANLPQDRISISGAAPPSLEDSLIGLSVAKQAFAANAKVIGVQDDMDQALLDILT